MKQFVPSLLVALSWVACTGAIGSGSRPRDDDARAGAGAAADAGHGGSANVQTAALMPLRRLSRLEHANTVHDLLGLTPTATEQFASEVSGASGYPEGGPLSPDELDRMLAAAESLATRYREGRLAADLGCPLATADEACATAFIERFARRAYRHEPSADELADLRRVFDEARADHSPADALATVVEAALVSPRFNYRWELGDDRAVVAGSLVKLGPYELASRLSYFLWASMPDDALLAAAAQGKLATADGLRAQADRLLTDPRGVAGVRSFFASWSPLGALATAAADPAAAAVRASLLESSLRLVDEAIGSGGDHRFATLLAGDHAFADRTVAQRLGVAGSFGDSLQRVSLAGTGRAGLFTQPGFLAATASTTFATIIHRGRFVFERLGACEPVPPPTGAIPDPPPRSAGASVREQLAAHAAGSCASCHALMDDAGFAFDGFDAQGATRSSDDYGHALDTAGTLTIGGAKLAFRDAADLVQQLAARPEPRRCFAQHLTAYALRAAAGGDNASSADAAAASFIASDGDVRELLMAAAATFAFAHRRPATDEVLR